MNQFLQILRHTRYLRKYYIGIALLGVLISLLGQINPFIVRSLIDDVVMTIDSGSGGFDQGVVLLIILSLVVQLLVSLLDNVNGYIGDMMSIRVRKLLSDRYYERLMQMPIRYFDDQLTGTIIGRLERSIETIATFFKQISNLFLQIMVSAVMSLIIIAYYAWEVALVMAALIPIYAYFTNKASKLWAETQGKILKDQNTANGRFGEVVSQMRVVRSFTREKDELRRFSGSFTKMIGKTKSQSRQWHVLDVGRRSSMDIILSLSVTFIIWRSYQGSLTVGEVFLLFTFTQLMTRPLTFISFIVDSFQKMVTASEDYFEVMSFDLASTPESNVEDATKNNFNPGEGVVEFENVRFSYGENSKDVLKDISLSIKAGEHVALVGESGGGKSTMTGLIQGFYTPQQGRVLVDDQDVSAVKRSQLLSSIGVVFQDPVLFSGSIMENIRYGRPKASDKEVLAAAKAANAHDFIQKIEKGYKSEIGERGVKLSGGQKQRISIARALLNNPAILILDEATSSLDTKSELQVQDALDNLMKGRTTIMIAHRLSTIANVDTIITLKNGRVDEVGSPAKLASTGGVYSELLNLQKLDEEELKKQLAEYDIIG